MWAGTDQHRATGTSLAAILPIASVGAAAYYFVGRTPQVDLAIAASLVVGGVSGVIAGAIVARRVSEQMLRILVAVLLLGVGLKEIHDAVFGSFAAGHGAAAVNLALWEYILIAVSGLVIGLLSGLAGLGGGIFIVPLLVIGFGISQRIAQGTSLVAILPTAAIGAIIHHANGDVDVRAAATIAAAGVPAAIAGALLALWVPQQVLLGLFGVFLLVAAARTWPRGLRSSPAERP